MRLLSCIIACFALAAVTNTGPRSVLAAGPDDDPPSVALTRAELGQQFASCGYVVSAGPVQSVLLVRDPGFASHSSRVLLVSVAPDGFSLAQTTLRDVVATSVDEQLSTSGGHIDTDFLRCLDAAPGILALRQPSPDLVMLQLSGMT